MRIGFSDLAYDQLTQDRFYSTITNMSAESEQHHIPMSSPDITDLEKHAVQQVLDTPYLSMGPRVVQFEDAIKTFTGTRNALAVNSGTAGLHLCIRAIGVETDHVVITTPFSFVASTNVILFEKGIPVFVDVDPLTGNMDINQLSQALQDLSSGGKAARKWLPRKGAARAREVKALLPIDVFGQPAEMDTIMTLAHDYGIKVIEDSCEALGATYHGRAAGTLGDFGVFGFYPNKQVTTGEGGMIITDDDQAAEYMRALRNQGRAPGDTWLSHTHLGYNYRLDEMSAAMGAIQMTRMEELLRTRQQVAEWYLQRLPEIPGIETPGIEKSTTRNSWFVFVIRLPKGADRQKIAAKLADRGIPVRPYFLPIHLQPYMIEMFGYQTGDYPVTEDLGNRGLALPFSGIMTEAQVEWVCQELRSALS